MSGNEGHSGCCLLEGYVGLCFSIAVSNGLNGHLSLKIRPGTEGVWGKYSSTDQLVVHLA